MRHGSARDTAPWRACHGAVIPDPFQRVAPAGIARRARCAARQPSRVPRFCPGAPRRSGFFFTVKVERIRRSRAAAVGSRGRRRVPAGLSPASWALDTCHQEPPARPSPAGETRDTCHQEPCKPPGARLDAGLRGAAALRRRGVACSAATLARPRATALTQLRRVAEPRPVQQRRQLSIIMTC